MRPISRTMNPVIPFVAYLKTSYPMQSNQNNAINTIGKKFRPRPNKGAEKTREVVRDWFGEK